MKSRIHLPALLALAAVALAALFLFHPDIAPALLAAGPMLLPSSRRNDFAAFRGKLTGGAHYERRNAPDLVATIEAMAQGLESFKAEQRRRVEQLETRMSRPGLMHGPAADAAGTADRIEAPTPAEIRAFGEMLRTGDRSKAIEARASVNAGTSGQGLEAVATWFDSIIRSKARSFSPMLRRVSSQRVASFPAKHVISDSSVMGSGWTGEQDDRTNTDSPLPKVVEVPPGEWYAMPTVTEWAITDLSFDVEAWLRRELISEYAENLQSAIVGGNGTNKPKGFLAGPTPVTNTDASGLRAFGTLQYYPTGQATTLPTTTAGTIDYLLDIVHGLRAKHRQNASWAMNALTMSTLRKFKDADGRPVLLDSMITGQPAMLLGYPVDEVEDMPVIGAGAFPIAFGDFEAGYVLDEDATGIRITRDDITTKGFVKFYSRCRVGGKIMDSDAIKLGKVAAS